MLPYQPHKMADLDDTTYRVNDINQPPQPLTSREATILSQKQSFLKKTVST